MPSFCIHPSVPFLWFGKTTEYWGLQGGCSVWPQGAVQGLCRWCYLTLGVPAWLLLASLLSPKVFPLGDAESQLWLKAKSTGQ